MWEGQRGRKEKQGKAGGDVVDYPLLPYISARSKISTKNRLSTLHDAIVKGYFSVCTPATFSYLYFFLSLIEST